MMETGRRKLCLLSFVLVIFAFSPAIETCVSRAAEGKWKETVSEAEREGKIVIYGQGGAIFREGLVEPFQKQYPRIVVEYTGTPGSRIPPKIIIQRKAGEYLVDLVITGPTSIFTGLKPAGALDPIQPFLVGPAVQDESKWMGGQFEFVDNEQKYLFVQHTYVHIPFVYNRDLVSASDFKSHWDLLDPKWKGKLIMYHPLDPGPGIGTVARWMMSKELGKDFVRQLFTTQDVTFSRNNKQILDWIAHGRYLIALAFRTNLAADMIEKGIHLEFMDPYRLKEAPATSLGAAGVVSVINRAPHPNAAKVYLNYLLSREGQYALSKAADAPSRRLDVPTDHFPVGVFPIKAGMKIVNAHGEDSIHIRTETAEFVKSLIR